MANTYSQMYVHVVFAVKRRESLISEQHREQIQRYITGILQKRNSKMISIYCMPDHAHIFIGLNPATALSDLVRDIKAGSSNYINDQDWFKSKFYWQEGYGCFSYSKSLIPKVAKYIENQAEHHKKKSFKDEYIKCLKIFDVDYDEKYLFEWFD
jgi:REP element-mobilizing transposase RayT